MKIARPFLFTLVVIVSIILCQQIISQSLRNQSRKQDLAELSNIRYGLFSINAWKEQVTEIIQAEITQFDLSDNKKDLKPIIEAQLNELINHVDRRLKEKNNKTFNGRFKQAFINGFVDIKEIKEGIPGYADSLMQVMERPKNKHKLKAALQGKVDEYFDKTFEQQDTSKVQVLLHKLSSEDIKESRKKLEIEVKSRQEHIFLLAQILILLAIMAFAISGLSKEVLSRSQYLMLVTLLFLLVLAGVTTPMIDLEAKISELSFMLFNYQIKFTDQVLYFQTKSILDVFWLMIRHPDFKMNVVGILMVLFSVVLPISKLASTVAYYYNPWNSRNNKWVQFFVLKSGKWSMTDVMIIAIFMAYIGFNGIVESQFGELSQNTEELMILTTNGTSLQHGFYLFLTYSLLAMFLSDFLTKRQAYDLASK